jgi:uncharacterized protein (DUF2164 family)
MKSKITGGSTEKLFSAKILNKYDVDYFKCIETGFLQTEEPYWLDEAYSSAITKLDVGLVSRNEVLRNKITPILANYFDGNGRFLDYAGGYGLFTRMMRDRGYNYYHADPYCKNIFAEFFDVTDLEENAKFELVTAFEVFEHLANPIEGIKDLLGYSDNLFFTTELQPDGLKNIQDWWYFIPETGQHVSLFTEKSLAFVAKQLGYNFYSDGINTHLFTKKPLVQNPFQTKKLPYLIKTMKRKVDRYFRKLNPERETLLQRDWQFIKDDLKELN